MISHIVPIFTGDLCRLCHIFLFDLPCRRNGLATLRQKDNCIFLHYTTALCDSNHVKGKPYFFVFFLGGGLLRLGSMICGTICIIKNGDLTNVPVWACSILILNLSLLNANFFNWFKVRIRSQIIKIHWQI